MSAKRIAVIGAGAAGICSAKYLLDAGHEVAVFEIGTQVGGLWVYNNDNGRSSAYASLHINSEKRNTQFHDFPFDENVQEFPSHHDMAAYLRSYADRFGVTPRIRFASRVTRVTPVRTDASIGWELEVEDGNVERFDAVVIAAGHLTENVLPGFAKDFTGEVMHSHYYRTPEKFAGKRVLVVGSGNSGCDITSDICAHAAYTVMAARSPELIVPKLFMGIPVTQWTGMLERPWLPSAAPRIARSVITRLVHGKMERFGLRTPQGRTHPTSHATLINLLAYRRAFAKPGVVSVAGRTVTFADRSTEDFDTMVCATGYEIKFPYLDERIVRVKDGGMDLFKRAVVPEWPGLYFLGYFNTAGSSNLRMFEVQSRWIASVESGTSLLPTRAEMRRDIEETTSYYAAHYPGGPRYALEIEPLRYTKEVEAEERKGQQRLHRVPGLSGAQRANRSVEDLLPVQLPDLGHPAIEPADVSPLHSIEAEPAAAAPVPSA